MKKGETFNESVELRDSATGRFTRRLTQAGLYNETPTYHLNAAFTADSRYLIFGTAREGHSALMKADVETGDLTVLTVADGMGIHEHGESRQIWCRGTTGGGYTGIHTALVQASGWAIAVLGKSLRAVHTRTLEERVLMADIGEGHYFGAPAGSLDGRKALVNRVRQHPDLARGLPRSLRDYHQAMTAEYGGQPTDFLQVDIDTGAVEVVLHDDKAGCHHIQPCPSDGEVWLIDRDWPPLFWCGGDHHQTTRLWLLNSRTKQLTPINPRNANRFETHTNWGYQGDRVYYHGPAKEGGEFMGVADRAGNVLWEMVVPNARYGHACSHTRKNVFITDGIVSPDLVTAVHYEELDADGQPRIEVLARHATQWNCMPGQYSHPHCHVSPDGRWLSYNRGENGRSDVYLVRLG
jgi:hypothetical protein